MIMGKLLKDYKIAFMGQTGRGKSTLINALFGTQYSTNSVVECTTYINSATILNIDISIPYEAITIMDTPGIGASLKKDKLYKPYYLQCRIDSNLPIYQDTVYIRLFLIPMTVTVLSIFQNYPYT